jgi:AcrR family transcriptional regulator
VLHEWFVDKSSTSVYLTIRQQMARPTEHDKKLDLAKSAVEVMGRLGFDTPMSRIADELGVKRPTLLYHFPTRGHIVETALQQLLVEQMQYVLEKVELHEHVIDRLYAQIRAVHEFHHGREQRIALLTQAAVAAGGRLAEMVDIGNRVFESERRAAADRIREGIASGTVWPCDADALMSLIRAISDGLFVQRVMTGVELAPVHEFIWTQLLCPLKRTQKQRKHEPRFSGARSPEGRGPRRADRRARA